ncbi:hypothetical protein JHK85_044998 [Glycine max]|nr:hypothetical protein JHK85_044998 [Glycine max]
MAEDKKLEKQDQNVELEPPSIVVENVSECQYLDHLILRMWDNYKDAFGHAQLQATEDDKNLSFYRIIIKEGMELLPPVMIIKMCN